MVVLLKDQEEMIEKLDAGVLNTKIIDNEAKLHRSPFVFPKPQCCSGFVIALLF
jgi:hypothetical protein